MSIQKIEKDTHGEKISLVEANKMIAEFKRLDSKIIKSIDPTVNESHEKEKLGEFKVREYNAFIFHRNLIDRFFDGSETDANGNSVKAQYLMVLLGAHPEKKGDFKAGSFTVLTAGCNLGTKTNSAGKEEPVFYPINTHSQDQVNEYPPKHVITELEVESGNQPTIKYFRVI